MDIEFALLKYILRHFFMLKQTALFLLATVLICSACENDIDVNAEWKETAVVYGLLDPGTPTQFIRIQRTYQNGYGDAIKLAQVGDSLFFDTLSVSLDVYQNGNYVTTHIFYPDQSIIKDTGMFAAQPNTLYACNNAINKDYNYHLKIRNPRSGKEYTSSTSIVRPSFIMGGLPALFYVAPNRSTSFRVNTGVRGLSYDMVLKFYYMEYDSSTSDSNLHSIQWINVSNFMASDDKGGEELIMKLTGSLMYDFVAANVFPKAKVYRRMKSCKVSFVGGAAALVDYISLSRPSIGIVQKKPEYSNISNGLGIFSSRCTQSDSLAVNDSMNYHLQNLTSAKGLGFRSKL
ncbi:MAG: hypothetical protein EXR21_04375 [Flavobacteriaceae bacterium]|nr:hypothetical protein [Flavobacteriaceae bacterium]